MLDGVWKNKGVNMMNTYTWKEWFALPRAQRVNKTMWGLRLRFWIDKTWLWILIVMIWVGMVIVARLT